MVSTPIEQIVYDNPRLVKLGGGIRDHRKEAPVTLSNFAVVHERGSGGGSNFDNPLIHCFDGKQLVLAFVTRQALDDYFRVPGGQPRTLQQWNLVVHSNRAAFEKIIAAKYGRGERSTYDAYGQSYPRVDVILEDMQGSGEKFTDDVLKLKAESSPCVSTRAME